MTSLIGTVHKPQQPPIPEPEGWIILEYCSGGWWVDSGYLVKPSERESLEDAVSTIKNTPIRLVEIGPAPKVPVEAIRAVVACAVEWRHLEEMANRQTPYAQRCVNEVQRWLSAQEEVDK